MAQLQPRPGFAFTRLDIGDREAVRSFGRSMAAKGRVDAVVNLAARAGVRASVADPWAYVAANVTGNLNLLELWPGVGHRPVRAGLHFQPLRSAQLSRPYREDADTDTPLSPYAASKKAAEAMSHSYQALHGFDVTVLRFFTLYGPAGRPDMSLFRFVQWISEGREVDGLRRRQPAAGLHLRRRRRQRRRGRAHGKLGLPGHQPRLGQAHRPERRHPADRGPRRPQGIGPARSPAPRGRGRHLGPTFPEPEACWAGSPRPTSPRASANPGGLVSPQPRLGEGHRDLTGRPAAVPGDRTVPERARAGATRGHPRQFRPVMLETQGRIVFAQCVPAGTPDPPAHPGEVTESGLRCTTGNRVYPKRVPGVRIPSSPPPNLLISRTFEAGPRLAGRRRRRRIRDRESHEIRS